MSDSNSSDIKFIKKCVIFLTICCTILITFLVIGTVANIYKQKPYDRQQTINQARQQFDLGEYRKLKNTSQQIINENSNEYQGYWYLGLAHMNLGENEPAISAFRESMERTLNTHQINSLKKYIAQCQTEFACSNCGANLNP